MNRIRFGNHPVGQALAERIPQSQHQLDAFEAAEAEFKFEMRRWAAHGQLFEPSRPAQLRQQLAHRRKRLRFNRGRAADFGSCCAHLCTYGANKPSAKRFRYPKAYAPLTSASLTPPNSRFNRFGVATSQLPSDGMVKNYVLKTKAAPEFAAELRKELVTE